MRRLLGWVPTALAALGGLVILAETWVAAGLGWTVEDHGVQGLLRRLAAHGWTGIWSQGAASYRPLCGSLLLLQDELGFSLPLRYVFSDLLHALFQASSSLAVAGQWRRAHQERAEAIELLAAQLDGGAQVVLLGQRNRFQRRLLGAVGSSDVGAPGAFGPACIPQPREHYDFSQDVRGARTLLVEGELQPLAACRWRFALRDYACDPRRYRPSVGPVGVERIEDDAAVALTVDPGGVAAVLWLDAEGQVRLTPLRCESRVKKDETD